MSGTVKLFAGTLDGAGNLTPGSMSRLIDDALFVLVPPGANEHMHGRRKLALAIAQGVIGHLKAQEQAFMVTVRDGMGGGGTVDEEIRIDV